MAVLLLFGPITLPACASNCDSRASVTPRATMGDEEEETRARPERNTAVHPIALLFGQLRSLPPPARLLLSNSHWPCSAVVKETDHRTLVRRSR
jgi:hypothetical protein